VNEFEQQCEEYKIQIKLLTEALNGMVMCFRVDKPPASELIRQRLKRAREVLAEYRATR